MSCAEFLAKHQITQVTQPPYNPDLPPSDFWLFPKLKSPLKGKRFQTIDETQENTTGQLIGTLWGPKVPTLVYFEGDWGVVVLYAMFLASYIFFDKCLYFSFLFFFLMSLFFILHGWIPSGQISYIQWSITWP